IRAGAMVREILASARAERVGTLLTVLLVAAVSLSVIVTTGRTVGVEQHVLGSIDAAGTRAIVVRAEPAAGVDASVVDRLAAVDGIEWVGAFGPAADVRNARIADNPAVASRTFWSPDPSVIAGSARLAGIADALLVTGQAQRARRLPDGTGTVETTEGLIAPVVGRVGLPDYLTFMEPLAVRQGEGDGAVAIIVVVAKRAADVEALTPVVGAATLSSDPSLVSVSTSDELAQLQLVVAGQLGGHSRSLAAAILLATGAMVFALMFGLVMIRRKEFGRRRALGASQTLIVMLVLGRTAVAAIPGAV